MGQRPLHTEEAWNLTTQCLGIVGLSIGGPMLGLIVILNNPVSVKDLTV